MTGYYDYVLALIPGVLVGVTATLALFGTPLRASLFAGSGASLLVVGHALFVRGPVVGEPTVSGTGGRSTPDGTVRSEPPASGAD